MRLTAIFARVRRQVFARPLGAFVLAIPVAVAGCGVSDPPPPRVTVYPVKGKVLLADGSPLKGGHVWFVPTKDSVLNSYGEISPDGSFTLTTGNSGEGAPSGEFKVRIEPAELPAPTLRAGTRRDLKPLPFPEKYTDEDASKIVVTVKAGPNDLEPFRLK
jgi:hypothetical protein